MYEPVCRNHCLILQRLTRKLDSVLGMRLNLFFSLQESHYLMVNTRQDFHRTSKKVMNIKRDLREIMVGWSNAKKETKSNGSNLATHIHTFSIICSSFVGKVRGGGYVLTKMWYCSQFCKNFPFSKNIWTCVLSSQNGLLQKIQKTK